MIITFFAAGLPKTAGSKRAFPIRKGGVFTGRVAVVDANKNAKDWKATVASCASDAYSGPLLDGPIRLTIEFRLPRPKGHFGTGKNVGVLRNGSPKYPLSKPDALKLARCAEDALSSVIWKDDAQIVDEILLKRYSERPGAWVEIEPL